MAKDKKSFIAYCEWQETFNSLSDIRAGKLIKHIFSYVNDENPITKDDYVNLSFIPIKQTLKRDLKKYDVYIDKQRENGKKGGRPIKPKETQITQPLIEKPKKADSVNVNVSDSVSDIKTIKDFYTVDLFIKDWNELKTKHTKKKSGIVVLDSGLKDQFYKLIKDGFDRETIIGGLIGLFKQSKFPNGQDFTTDPRHFLKDSGIFINKYHDAYINRNTNVYGELKNEY